MVSLFQSGEAGQAYASHQSAEVVSGCMSHNPENSVLLVINNSPFVTSRKLAPFDVSSSVSADTNTLSLQNGTVRLLDSVKNPKQHQL